jgi:hypothetical protein
MMEHSENEASAVCTPVGSPSIRSLARWFFRILFFASEPVIVGFVFTLPENRGTLMPLAVYAWVALLISSVGLFWLDRWWGWLGFITWCLGFILFTFTKV